MFLGLQWYWWAVIALVLVISIPFKIKFMKWWGEQQKEKQSNPNDKWGNEQ